MDTFPDRGAIERPGAGIYLLPGECPWLDGMAQHNHMVPSHTAALLQGTFDFTGVAAALDIPGLPADYAALAAEYGQEIIDGVSLYLPGGYIDIRHVQYPEHYDNHILCGGTEDRTTFVWNVNGPDPDTWSIIFDDATTWHEHPGTLIDFFTDHFLGRLRPMLIFLSPDDPPRQRQPAPP
jgi:hypothetical protein